MSVKCKSKHMTLYSASTKGYTDMLKNKRANLHQKNEGKMTALHMAAKYGRCHDVMLLLSRGSNPNGSDAAGKTSLHIAAEHSYRRIVKMLLYNGANMRAQDIWGNTPLHEAVKRKCKAIIKLLVENGSPMDFQNKKGETVLHIACLHCDTEIVSLLLNHKADCNALTADGSTPLHYAVKNVDNSADLVPLLIKAGAAVLVMNRAREVPFTIAIKQEINWYSCELLGHLLGKGLELNKPTKQWCLDLLIDEANIMLPALSTVFTVAIKYDDRPLFELLIEKGIPIHYKNQFGTTPLLEAVTSNNLHAAKVLLRLGADPNDKDSHNKSPLRLAESEEMVELLLMYNADIYEPNLLHRIVSKKTNGDIFSRMIEKVLDHEEKKKLINKKCSRGYSMLRYAMETENVQMLANILYVGVESEEFFNVFMKTYSLQCYMDMQCFWLMTQQVVIFEFQGITNENVMEMYKSEKADKEALEIYQWITRVHKKMAVTRIYEDFPFTYYDLLMKRGKELLRILRIAKIRSVIEEPKKWKEFDALGLPLVLNLIEGFRRLQLELEFTEELGAFLPVDVACHMSQYFNNSDLLKCTSGFRGPGKDTF